MKILYWYTFFLNFLLIINLYSILETSLILKIYYKFFFLHGIKIRNYMSNIQVLYDH